MTARVLSIHRYPVKSMLGEDLATSVVGERGLLGDRAYALLDADDGIVASAKNPRKWAALLTMSARFTTEPEAGAAPPPVEVTLPDGSVLDSRDRDVDDRLSAAVGRPVRLITEHPADAQFEEVWPDLEGLAPLDFIASTRTGTAPDGEAISTMPLALMAAPKTFFDLASVHLLTTATLAHLAELEPAADFDPRRYRPNLLIETDGTGFVEDPWVGNTLGFGDALLLEVSMLTMRCVMTTLAQRDLAADAGTLRTLAQQHRRDIPGLGIWACAGVYAGVVTGGTVRVGDQVQLGQ
jgi:uncharacterized protein YcbX